MLPDEAYDFRRIDAGARVKRLMFDPCYAAQFKRHDRVFTAAESHKKAFRRFVLPQEGYRLGCIVAQFVSGQ